MKKNWINLVFVIDESGSMYGSVDDVVGGFKSMIDEQKKLEDGKLTVSLYTFNDKVTKKYLGANVEDIGEFVYKPRSSTSLYDALCESIDDVGKWLYEKDKNGEEMPSKTMVVIITDGGENSSIKFNIKDVRERLNRQETKYNWSFVYLGNDLSDAKDADDISIKYRGFTTKNKFYNNYNVISSGIKAYRIAETVSDANVALDSNITTSLRSLNEEYKADTGINLGN